MQWAAKGALDCFKGNLVDLETSRKKWSRLYKSRKSYRGSEAQERRRTLQSVACLPSPVLLPPSRGQRNSRGRRTTSPPSGPRARRCTAAGRTARKTNSFLCCIIVHVCVPSISKSLSVMNLYEEKGTWLKSYIDRCD